MMNEIIKTERIFSTSLVNRVPSHGYITMLYHQCQWGIPWVETVFDAERDTGNNKSKEQ